MAQSSSAASPVDLAVLEQEIDSAESIADLSAVTAQILARVAVSSDRSADQLGEVAKQAKDPDGSLVKIARGTDASACHQEKIAENSAWSAWHLGRIAFHSEHLKDLAENSAWSAWHLGRIAFHSEHLKGLAEASAAAARHLGEIAGHSEHLRFLDALAKRGDRENPLHVAAERPLHIAFDPKAATAIQGFLEIVGDCANLKHDIQRLQEDLLVLQQHYRSHHHERLRDPPISGDPAAIYESSNRNSQ
jgi:hypothetical protein